MQARWQGAASLQATSSLLDADGQADATDTLKASIGGYLV
jgi:hypothetical protein